jgi:biotin carboxyl carrier protein
MQTYIATSREQTHRLEVHEDKHGLHVRLDNREFPVDVLRVGPHHYSLLLDGRSYEIDVLETEEASLVLVNGQPFRVEIQRERELGGRSRRKKATAEASEQTVLAPMPGKVTKLLVKPGDVVRAGDGIVVVEAMKMENELKASVAGTVKEIRTAEGNTVNGGDILVVLE